MPERGAFCVHLRDPDARPFVAWAYRPWHDSECLRQRRTGARVRGPRSLSAPGYSLFLGRITKGDADMENVPSRLEPRDSGRPSSPGERDEKASGQAGFTFSLMIKVPAPVWSALGGAAGYALIDWLLQR